MLNKFGLLLSKFRSAIERCSLFISTSLLYIGTFGNPTVVVKKNCQFGHSVKLMATDGGSIFIGERTSLADHVQVTVQGGRLTIGDDVFIGIGSIIVCRDEVFIGSNSLIAEYVVIRDQDHSLEVRPVRNSGFQTSPVHIGQDVLVGCKSSILRGSYVGDRSVIGAHSLVKSHIAEDMLAMGIPAKAVKRLSGES